MTCTSSRLDISVWWSKLTSESSPQFEVWIHHHFICINPFIAEHFTVVSFVTGPWVCISSCPSKMSAPSQAPKVRSLYRRILRELPARQTQQTILSNPSVLQKQIRTNISDEPSTEKPLHIQLDEMEQYVQYVKAQRMYTTLLER